MTDSSPSTLPTCILMLDDIVWTPGHEIDEAIEHLAKRFARSTPLDADAVLAAPTLAQRCDVLAVWAEGANVPLDRELGRYLDEHLSMRVRPDSSRARAVRALATTHRVVVASSLPPHAASSIALHAGIGRAMSDVVGDVRSVDKLTELVADTDAELVVIAAGAPQLIGINPHHTVEILNELPAAISH